MIHPTAIVDAKAKIGSGVSIGAYSIVGAEVEIGDGTTIGPHVVIEGATRIGRDNRIFQFASIGAIPQDKKFGGERSELLIGDRNLIREFVTLNRGTAEGGGATRIGNDNWIMAYVHVAHDCRVGDHAIFSNNATLAGHVTIGDYAILSGFSGVHQFCRIGAHAIIGGCAKIVQDVPPFLIADGNPAQLRGVNHVGLERRGFTEADIKALRRAYRILADKTLNFSQAVEKIEASEDAPNAHVQTLVQFLKTTERGVIRPEPLAGS
jgi:UDP-N-acetylglucosamine acyltransferase